MRVYAHRVAPYDNRLYLVADERGDAILIDPSMGETEALATIRAQGLRVLEILNTHGHEDHVAANAPMKRATQARVAIHGADAYRLDARTAPASSLDFEHVPADDLIAEGPLSYLRNLELQALHTPGHTEGSTCFYFPSEAVLFSGDVLFAGNIGRTDLPGGDAAQMEASLARIAALPAATKVYPGHGPSTTIGAELRWLRGLRLS